MTATQIARALDGRRCGRWWSCRCPAHDDRSPSLSLRDGDRGLILKCWAGCDTREVIAELQRMGLIGGRAYSSSPRSRYSSSSRSRSSRSTYSSPSSAIADPAVRGDDTARRIAAARAIWDSARDARGSPVVRYLAGRGITIPTPLALRWAPVCRHPSGVELPAMIARIDNIDAELSGIHRTFLRLDGSGKADIEPVKAMLGRAAGGAVRLAPAAEMLMVAEGIETALATMQAMEMPAWAALSTSGMEALALPPIVRTIIILADNDANGAGQTAARTAAQRWLVEGRRVRIALPPISGTDFADVLAGHAYAEICDAVA